MIRRRHASALTVARGRGRLRRAIGTACAFAVVALGDIGTLSGLALARRPASRSRGHCAQPLGIGRIVGDRRTKAERGRKIARQAGLRAPRVATDTLRAIARLALNAGTAIRSDWLQAARAFDTELARSTLRVIAGACVVTNLAITNVRIAGLRRRGHALT